MLRIPRGLTIHLYDNNLLRLSTGLDGRAVH